MRLLVVAVVTALSTLTACQRSDPPKTATSTPAATPASTAGQTSTDTHTALGGGADSSGSGNTGDHNAPAASDHGAMAGMDHASASAVHAGWYRAGRFQPCGSTNALQVTDTAAIDAQIRTGGMSAADPVYVRLEGHLQAANFALMRVVQVGAPAPVRDCPMTGTSTQG